MCWMIIIKKFRVILYKNWSKFVIKSSNDLEFEWGVVTDTGAIYLQVLKYHDYVEELYISQDLCMFL